MELLVWGCGLGMTTRCQLLWCAGTPWQFLARLGWVLRWIGLSDADELELSLPSYLKHLLGQLATR